MVSVGRLLKDAGATVSLYDTTFEEVKSTHSLSSSQMEMVAHILPIESNVTQFPKL
jgi:hypothetical protein